MTTHDTDGARKLWSSPYRVPLALTIAGLVLPSALAVTFRWIWPPLAEVIGISLIVLGLLLYMIETRDAGNQQIDVVVGNMRRLSDRVEASTALVESIGNDIAAVAKTVDSERRNLGMVAGGLGEMRQIVHLERRNLGMLANGVDDIRDVLRTFQHTLEETRSAMQVVLARIDEAAAEARAVALRNDDLHGEMGVQRHNLGMVAGALDDLRRRSAGVERFDARQTAFEDALIAIADRIDRAGGAEPSPSGSSAPAGEASHAALSAAVPEHADD